MEQEVLVAEVQMAGIKQLLTMVCQLLVLEEVLTQGLGVEQVMAARESLLYDIQFNSIIKL
jgi:hypothetical protein